MEVSIKNLNDCTSEFTCSMSVEDLAPHFDKAYREAVPMIEIKGFRKGKVPLPMIKKLFGEEIEYKAVDEITNEVFKNELKERSINPIGTPIMTDLQFKPGTPLSFTIKYETKPVVEAKDFRGTQVEAEVIAFDEQAYEKELMHRRRYFATYEEAQSVDGEEYIVTADTEEFDEKGNIIPAHSRKDVRFPLYEPQLEKEIVAALKSTPVGKTADVELEHAHGDHVHKVHLKITVKKIEKPVLPELNDEFAAKASYDRFKTIDEYTKDLRESLEKYYTERNDKAVESELLKKVVEPYAFTVPASLTESVLDAYIEDVKSQQPGKELPRGFDTKKYRDTYREGATWEAKWMLIREQLLAKENIQVTDEDIEKLAEEIAPKSGIDKERLVKYYKESDTVSEKILSDKLMKLIKDSAVITTKTVAAVEA
ncbi:MAG TPA: trigger factor [Bacteroidota bacterium]|nr:trigger factor [Bacteroidota bacterium]